MNKIPPSINSSNLKFAKLYADRTYMAIDLVPQFSVIGEIGVANGNFSNFIMSQLHPSKFIAFDTFDMDQYDVIWGMKKEEIFNNMSHLQYYKSQFANAIIEVGFSCDTLRRYPNDYFDFLYIDADHSYESAAKDAEISYNKIKNNGIIFFNDYTMFDHINMGEYGVVKAANEFIIKYDLQVLGLSLHNQMFCDLAVRVTK